MILHHKIVQLVLIFCGSVGKSILSKSDVCFHVFREDR